MIQFDYPEFFLLAIPLWFLVKRYGWTQGPTGWLRVVILVLLLTALSVPRLNLAGEGMDIIVVVDRSRSMPAGSDQSIKDLVNDLENNRGPGDRISLVVFGTGAEIERELSETAVLNEFTRVIDHDGSDLNEAMLMALDRRNNPDRPARVIVLTDGIYNGPSPLYAARRAREEGVPVDFREFAKPLAGDLAIDSVLLPREVAPNEPFQFSVMAYADEDTNATVIVRRNGIEIARRKTGVVLGMNRLIFRDRVEAGGMHQYSAEIIADESAGLPTDGVPENNRGSAVMRVKSGPRVLLVTHDGKPGNIGRALESGQVPFDVIQPSDSPMTLDALEAWRAVILENIPADTLGRVRMERLRQYVEDVGGGLMMTGGRQSFGTGGYYKSPLDDILPVAMHSLEETRRTRAAIVIVLDRSGSMGAPVSGGKTKMDMANIGTAECVRLLSPEDKVAVIAVDSSPHIIQKMTQVSNPHAINKNVLGIQSMGGGIFVYEGLVAAGRELLTATDYKTRHIILFSDAADSEQPGDYKKLLQKFASAGITVSVIGLGSESDVDAEFLKDIAKRGGGNIEFSNDPLDLPRLFTQDTMSMTRNMFLTCETESQPDGFPGRVLTDMRLLGELDSAVFPAVDGYNLTFLKPDASQGIISVDENTAPFSAFWYRGLGRVAAIPLELDGEFTGSLTDWERYETFVTTHARWLLGDSDSREVYVSLRQDGLDAIVEVELDPNRPDDQRGITPSLVVVPPSQERSEVITPDFNWTGPNTLEGRFRLTDQGTWRTLVKTNDREFTQGPALSLPYSPEYMPREGLPGGTETLESIAELSGGKARVNLLEMYDDYPRNSRTMRSLVPLLCLLSMLSIILEIAGRRWSWWERLAAWQTARKRSRQSTSETMDSQPDPATAGKLAPATRRRRKARKDRGEERQEKTPATKRRKSAGKTPTGGKTGDAQVDTGDVFSRAKRRAKDRLK